MSEIKNCKVAVVCPYIPSRNEIIYTKVTTGPDGEPFAVCHGCTNTNSSITCQRCMATITLMYMEKEPFPKQPFFPPLNRFAPMP